MYRLLPYNDDCVLEIDSNTAIFSSSKSYDKFLKWREENKEEYELEVKKKNAFLRHNKGEPHLLVDGNIVTKLTYAWNGQLFLKESFVDNIKVTEHNYNIDESKYSDEVSNVWQSKHYNKTGELTTVVRYYEDGTTLNETFLTKENNIYYKHIKHYDDNGVLTEFDILTSNDGKSYSKIENTIYNQKGNKVKKVFYKDDTITKSVEYFSELEDDLIKSLYIYSKDKVSYREYFVDEKLRAEGDFNLMFLMDGEWTFYHSNGIKESSYIFDNGDIKEGNTYYEDGSLLNSIKL